MRLLLQAGFVDTFRALHPDTIAYTWWNYMFHAREKNSGWRIDYFLASQRLMDRVEEQPDSGDVMGSDHCPWRCCCAEGGACAADRSNLFVDRSVGKCYTEVGIP